MDQLQWQATVDDWGKGKLNALWYNCHQKELTFTLGRSARPRAAQLTSLLSIAHQDEAQFAGEGRLAVDGAIGDADEAVLNLQRLAAVTVEALGLLAAPGAIAQTVSVFTAHQCVVAIAAVGGRGVEVRPYEADPAVGDGLEWTAVDVGALGRLSLPEAIALTESLLEAVQSTSAGALVGDAVAYAVIIANDRRVFRYVRTAAVGGRVLANPGQVVQIWGIRVELSSVHSGTNEQ